MGPDTRVLVIGIGNPLMADEGVGVRVIEQLMAGYEFPDNVHLADAGTMGFTLIDLLRETDVLLVIDAVDGTDQPPGTVLLLSPEDAAPSTVLHSLHDTRLADVLQAASLADIHVDAHVIGVQIARIEQWVLELTPAVEAAVPVAAGAALETLAEWGYEAKPREGTDVNARIIEALRTYEPMPETDS